VTGGTSESEIFARSSGTRNRRLGIEETGIGPGASATDGRRLANYRTDSIRSGSSRRPPVGRVATQSAIYLDFRIDEHLIERRPRAVRFPPGVTRKIRISVAVLLHRRRICSSRLGWGNPPDFEQKNRIHLWLPATGRCPLFRPGFWVAHDEEGFVEEGFAADRTCRFLHRFEAGHFVTFAGAGLISSASKFEEIGLSERRALNPGAGRLALPIKIRRQQVGG